MMTPKDRATWAQQEAKAHAIAARAHTFRLSFGPIGSEPYERLMAIYHQRAAAMWHQAAAVQLAMMEEL